MCSGRSTSAMPTCGDLPWWWCDLFWCGLLWGWDEVLRLVVNDVRWGNMVSCKMACHVMSCDAMRCYVIWSHVMRVVICCEVRRCNGMGSYELVMRCGWLWSHAVWLCDVWIGSRCGDPYYKVLLRTTKYYQVQLHTANYHSIPPSTTKYYKVRLCIAKYNKLW